MIYLLDVNVLLAFMDGQHAAHAIVHDWFAGTKVTAWATCPITENGFIRILSNPKYTNPTESPVKAAEILANSCDTPVHTFWPDDISLIGRDFVVVDRLLSPAQITDTYLLALARKHGGKLATLDRRLVADAVPDGAAHLHIIGQALQ